MSVPNPTDHFEAGCLLLVSRSQTTTQSDSIDSHGTGLGSPRMTARDQNFERYLIRKPVVRYNVWKSERTMFSKPIEKYCHFRINKLCVVNAGGTAMISHCQKSPSLLRRRSFQPHNSFDHWPLIKVNVLISKFAHTIEYILHSSIYFLLMFGLNVKDNE
jgi:hypothetical protein